MSRFAIDLGSLRQGLTRLELEAEAPELALAAGEWPGAVRGEFDVEKTGESVSVRGSLSATARCECVRCLRVFDETIRTPLEVFAERSGHASRHEEETLERDAYMKFHDGRQLDLAEAAREALLLELPMAPHCREDCRGLCPRCGADLNQGPCGCPRD